MEAEIEAMQKDLERFLEEVRTPVRDRKTGEIRRDKDGNIKYTKVREDTINERMKAYGQMKAKVAIFKERLGLEEAGLLAKLAALESTAKTVVVTAAQVMSDTGTEESQEPTPTTAQS